MVNANHGIRIGPVYSTVAASAVADAVAERYGLGKATECQLLNRGFNDCYRLTTNTGHFVVRLSSVRRRNLHHLSDETAFLAHLEAEGVPVAAAIPTRGGHLFTSLSAAEGTRALTVFRFLTGRRPALDEPADAAIQGMTLARIHDAAERYSAPEGGQRLDLAHLMDRPLAAVATLEALSAETGRILAGLASRLHAAIEDVDGLTLTRCHGDCHGLNARIDDADGTAVFFDFDDGGFGYLAYDLAVHLWAQVSFGRRRLPMWHAFVAGYRSVREIRPADFEAIRWFVAVRHLWLMGGMAQRADEWGGEALAPAWLDREAAFLLAWERDQLAPGLV